MSSRIGYTSKQLICFVSLLAIQLRLTRQFITEILCCGSLIVSSARLSYLFVVLWTSIFQLTPGSDSTTLEHKMHTMLRAGQPTTANNTATVCSSFFFMVVCPLRSSDYPAVGSNHVEGCVVYAKFDACGQSTRTIPCGLAHDHGQTQSARPTAVTPSTRNDIARPQGTLFVLSRAAYFSVQAQLSFVLNSDHLVRHTSVLLVGDHRHPHTPHSHIGPRETSWHVS